MLSQIADWVRGVLAGQDWLAWAQPHIAAAPDWALIIPAPFVLIVGAAWAVGRAKKSGQEAVDTLRTGASVLTGGAIKDKPKAANVDQVKALEEQIAALSDAQRRQVAALEAKLEDMNAKLVIAGEAAPIGTEEKARRDAAIVSIVSENTPAARQFEESILQRGALDLAALKAEARADQARAAEKWRDIAALARGVNDAEALAAYEEAHRLEPSDFWTCIELARLYQTWKGDIAAARRATEAAERAAGTPRERSVADNELGNVLVQAGDLAGARSRYEASLAALEKMAAQNPDSAQAQRDLSVSLEKLGDVLVESGDLAGARPRYEASLAVAEKLAAQNPGSAEAQRDVSVSLSKLGNVLVQSGDPAGARLRYEASLAADEKLAAQNPGSAEAQRDVSVSLNKLGDVLVQSGDLAGARSRYEASLAVREKLAAQNPGGAQAQRDVWVSLWNLADIGAARWGAVAERMSAMERSGTLFPADQKHLAEARERAAQEGAD